MLPTKFLFIWPSGFREDFLEINLGDIKKSSPLTPLGQMNPNLVGSIYIMSSIKIAHFVPIR
jgi:hypothetical protein